MISDAFAEHPELVEKVIVRASADSRVDDLTDVPEETWPHLARGGRFPTSYENVAAYIAHVGSVDADLALALTQSGLISVNAAQPQADRSTLSFTILASRDHLPSDVRSQLVAGLGLSDYLPVTGITPEHSALFAHLLREDLIADDDVTFAHLTATNWSTREGILAASDESKDLITPAFVGTDLAPLLQSARVGVDVKTAIATRADEFIATSNRVGIAALAQFAADQGCPMELATIESIAANGATPAHVVAILQPHLATIPTDRRLTILLALGGDFSQLRSVGRDKPKVRRTAGVVELLEHLKQLAIVKSFDPNDDPIKVNKRYKQQ